MATFGGRAPFERPWDEKRMRANLKQSEDYPDAGATSAALMHRRLELIKRGSEGNIVRTYRMAQEDLVTARLDEERQISELTTGRHPGLIGEGGRVRASQRAASQVFNGMK